MVVLYQAALIVCAVFLVGMGPVLAAAYRCGNKRRIRMLHLLRLGLILSACSYLLGIFEAPRPGHISLLSFLFCFFGTALIWLSFREHWKMQRERREMPPPTCAEEEEPGLAASPLTGQISDLRPLTLSAQQVLQYAQDEARRRRASCVDTEHLLLGLLRMTQSAGISILDCLGVGLEKIHLDLIFCTAANHRGLEKGAVFARNPPGLTPQAYQVIDLAGQEAHRFEKTTIGTEHLLLGLVLIGKGKAASVLFAEGVTVDRIRDEILKRKPGQSL